MPGNGWISVHRKIQNHWVWNNNESFDRRSAWIDILLMVNHEKKTILLGNELIEVDRGERITSERKLADRWKWSRTKVRNFLELLEKDEMIKIKKDTKKTTLKVLNYGDYQNTGNHERTTKRPRKDQRRTTKEPRKNTNNNDNNDNNDNKNNMSPKLEIEKIYNSLTDYWKQLFKDYIEIYKSKNTTGKITDNRHYNLLKEINQIYQEKKFEFDKKEYEITENIIETGLNKIIEKNISSLNYAKKVWIGELEKKDEVQVEKERKRDKQAEMSDEELEKYYEERGYR